MCAIGTGLRGARGSRTVLDRARGLEENGEGSSGGGREERDIFNHRCRGKARTS